MGTDKALLEIGGVPLLRRVVDRLTGISDDVVVVSDTPAHDAVISDSARRIGDLLPGKGAIGGILSGLTAIRHDFAVVVACDMPFLNQALILAMVEALGAFDAVVPRIDSRLQPTHAVYRRTCLPAIAQSLEGEIVPRATVFLDHVEVNVLEEPWFESLDALHRSFSNLNTARDLEAAKKLLESWK